MHLRTLASACFAGFLCLPAAAVPQVAGPAPAERVFVFLKTADSEAALAPEASRAAFAGHFSNMERLAALGWLAIAGPFDEPRADPLHRGLFVFDGVDLERGRELALGDPAVRAGVFEVEAHRWRTSTPVGAVRLLALLARERGDVGPEIQAGVRAFVLATTTDARAEEWLRPLEAEGRVLFAGRFVGTRDGELLAALDAGTLDEARGLLATLPGEPGDWTLHPWWASESLTELPRIVAEWWPPAPTFEVARVPEEGRLSAFRAGLAKLVDVFGVPLLATADTPDAKLLHAAHVMAQYLDNDEDGRVDDPFVACALREGGAFLAMGASARPEEPFDLDQEALERAGFLRGQDLYADETAPEDGFDAALEEVLHLVSMGYELAYPHAFGFRPGSRLADAMDVARGGQFEVPPDTYPPAAWYHYDDVTCDYACQAAEYFYWALTSLLGAQADARRARWIADEWELATPELVRTRDPLVHALLVESGFRLPLVLPDGGYRR